MREDLVEEAAARALRWFENRQNGNELNGLYDDILIALVRL